MTTTAQQIAERLADIAEKATRYAGSQLSDRALRDLIAKALAADAGLGEAVEADIRAMPDEEGVWSAYIGDLALCCNVTEEEAQFALQIAASAQQYIIAALKGEKA